MIVFSAQLSIASHNYLCDDSYQLVDAVELLMDSNKKGVTGNKKRFTLKLCPTIIAKAKMLALKSDKSCSELVEQMIIKEFKQ